MPDPEAGNTETNKEFSEQRASEERHESSSVTSVKSATKEKARLVGLGWSYSKNIVLIQIIIDRFEYFAN